MNKRQYIFIALMIILFYLSYKIVQHEYRKYIISEYANEQNKIIGEIRDDLQKSFQIIEYKTSNAYKSKILKKDQSLKMKGEEVTIITQEQTYNKYKTVESISTSPSSQLTPEESITKTMTNFQKWIYFFTKKDIR